MTATRPLPHPDRSLLRVDTAGASHELLDWCHEGRIRYSVGYDLTDTVRAAILEITGGDWARALDQDGSERLNGQVAEITNRLDLTGWPTGSRVIVRRERAHPGAQLTFTDEQPAVPRLRTQPCLARTRQDRPRPPVLDPAAAAYRPARSMRTQAPALPAAARRWSPLLPRSRRHAAPPGQLALGRPRHRIRAPPRTPPPA
jgi:hypothetical protein